jgi:hypothetical protein
VLALLLRTYLQIDVVVGRNQLANAKLAWHLFQRQCVGQMEKLLRQ